MDKYNKGLLIIILTTYICQINLCQGTNERDLLLTPKLALHVNGRTVFYKPPVTFQNTNKTDQVPWEQTLKHVTFLTLNSDHANFSNFNNVNNYNRFMNSTYLKTNEYIPKFGDIITLARGRLEKVGNNNYQFIEGVCFTITDCNPDPSKIVAFWQVQKIRHHNNDKKFNYELKFSVSPYNAEKSESGKREIKHNMLKSYIQKDNDYPNSFSGLEEHIAYRRSDDRRGFFDVMTKFNDIYTQPRKLQPIERNVRNFNNLNIGEYIRHPKLLPMPTNKNSRTGHYGHNVVFPTTYRPSYNFNFPKPNVFDQFSINLPPTTKPTPVAKETPVTHLHHHFYISKDETKNNPPSEITFKDSYETFHEPNNNKFFTPAPISNQIPIPPPFRHQPDVVQKPQTVFYMHPIPISPQLPIFLYPQVTEQQAKIPFKESELEQRDHHYSEPDPLYQNFDNQSSQDSTENDEEHEPPVNNPTNYETHRDIERHQKMDIENHEEVNQNTKFDSINAQLPPPQEGQDLRVPYVEVSASTETSFAPFVDKKKYELITAHLLPLREDQESTEPYVEKSTSPSVESRITMPDPHVTEVDQTVSPTISTSTSKQNEISLSSKRIDVPEKPRDIQHKFTPTDNIETTKGSFSFPKIETSNKLRTVFRSTTERPILKWKPKKKLKDLIEKAATSSTTNAPTTTSSVSTLPATTLSTTTTSRTYSTTQAIKEPIATTHKITTVLSTSIPDKEIPTKQSVKKSVSIKIGNKGKEQPLLKKVGNKKTLELHQANLVNIITNSSDIQVFKASEKKKNNDSGDLDDLELTKSIVEHVKSLNKT